MSDQPDDLLLPEGARLLHIGPQKTGTTTLQTGLHRARRELRSHGVRYHGKGGSRHRAFWAELGMELREELPPSRNECWLQLVEAVRDAGGARVCISSEALAKTELAPARIVDDLGSQQVHVVAVARPLDRLLPSQWQQRVRLGVSLTYEQWLEVVLGNDSDDPVWRSIWIPHDIERLVRRWSRATGARRFTLIVSDESDRAQQARVFEQLLGLPDGLIGVDQAPPRNQSLSLPRVEIVRRLNRAFETNGVPGQVAVHEVRSRLVRSLRTIPRTSAERGIPPLPRWAAERVCDLSARRAELVRSLGVRVVGDPDNLRTHSLAEEDTQYTEPVNTPVEVTARAIEDALDIGVDIGASGPHESHVERARNPRARDLLNSLRESGKRRARGTMRR